MLNVELDCHVRNALFMDEEKTIMKKQLIVVKMQDYH